MRKLLISLGIATTVLVGVTWFMLYFFASAKRGSNGSSEAAGSPARALPASPTPLRGKETPTKESDKGAGEHAAALASGAALHGRVTVDSEHGLEGDSDHGLEGARIFVQVTQDWSRSGFDRGKVFRDRLLRKETATGSGVVATQLTGSDGTYSIPIASIAPGTYQVLARHSEFAARAESWTWVPESTEMNFQLPAGDSIRGTVFNADGHPLAGAVVEAYTEEDGPWGWGGWQRPFAERDETDADGRFHLGVPAGTFRLVTTAKACAAEEVRGVASGTQDVEIFLDPARSLAGRVVDEKGTPVASAELLLFRRNGRDGGPGRGPGGGGDGPPLRVLRLVGSPEARALTGSEGTFLFEDLSPGGYVILSEKEGFAPGESEATLTDEERAKSIEMTLKQGKVLSGVVKDPDGNPVGGAFIAVAEDRSREEEERRARWRREGRPGGEERSGQDQGEGAAAPKPRRPEPLSPFRSLAGTETDKSGKFSFDTLPAGSYSLSVEAKDFVTYRQDGIEVGGQEELEVVLDSGIVLEGKVVASSDGKSVPGAKIVLRVSDDERRDVETDAEGRYEVRGFFPGRIDQINLSAKGFSLGLVEGFEIAPSPSVQEHDFKLDASATVAGRVSDSKGTPVYNARLSITPALDETSGEEGDSWRARRRQWTRMTQGRTDPEGKFSLADVNSGPSFQIAIEHPDFKPFRSDSFSIAPGERMEYLTFQLRSGARLEVLVRNPGGEAVRGARVRISLKEPEEPAEGAGPGGGERGRFGPGRGGRGDRNRGTSRISGPDGRAVFAGMAGGPYRVAAAVPGFQPSFSEVQLMEEEVTPFSVDLLPENVISGNVTDTAGMPLAGVRLEASRQTADGNREDSEARSNEKGAFRLGSLGEGTYRVRARLRGFADVDLESVEVNRETVNRETNVVLERLGGISGWVVTAETGAAVGKFDIRLRPAREDATGDAASDRFPGRRGPGGWPGRDRRSFTDPQGLFSIDNIAPGAYRLEVTAEGYTGVELRVKVAEGAFTEGIVARLLEGLSLIGLVQAKGTLVPVSGAEIFLLPLAPEDAGEKPPEDAGERREERRQERESRRAERRSGERLKPEVALARVAGDALRAAMWRGQSAQVTDESGAFELKDLTPGDYVVLVNHTAFVPAMIETVIGEDRIARSVEIQLETGEELSGTVTLANGSGAAGVNVIVRDANGILKRTVTDGAGRYQLQGLVPGAYSFGVRGAGGARSRSSATVKVEAGSNRYDYRLEDTTSG